MRTADRADDRERRVPRRHRVEVAQRSAGGVQVTVWSDRDSATRRRFYVHVQDQSGFFLGTFHFAAAEGYPIRRKD